MAAPGTVLVVQPALLVEGAPWRERTARLVSRATDRRPVLHALAVVGFVLLAPANDLSILLGLPALLVGIAIRTWALGHIEKGTSVCRSGPYAWVRHPLYLGSMVMVAGYCVMLNSPGLGLCAAVLAAGVYAAAIRREELTLSERFPSEYPEYMRQVPAVIPCPWRRLRTVHGARFSWRRAIANRAVRGALLALGAAALFDAKEDLIEALMSFEPQLHPWLAMLIGRG